MPLTTHRLRESIRQALQHLPSSNEMVALLNGLRIGPWQDSVFEDLRPIEIHRDVGAGAPDSEILTEKLYAHAFDNTVEESLTYVFHLPHGFKKDSTPVFHVHTTHNTSSPTGTDVRWKTTWYYARGYSLDALQTTGTVVSATQTPSAQFVHDIFGEDDLPCPSGFVGTLEPDGLIIVEVTREVGHADDDFAHDLFVLTADLHIELERHGTTERNRPFTSAGY